MYRRDDKEHFMLLTYRRNKKFSSLFFFIYKFLLLVLLEGAFMYVCTSKKCKTYYYSRVVQFLSLPLLCICIPFTTQIERMESYESFIRHICFLAKKNTPERVRKRRKLFLVVVGKFHKY